MIRLGPAGKPIGFKGSFLDCAPYLNEIGLNAIEVQFVRNIWMNEKQAIEFGESARKNNILVSVHAPYFINLCSEKKEVLEASKLRIIESARLASLMNAEKVVFHTGFYGKLKPQEAYKIVKENFDEITNKLRKEKINVLISPETMGNETKFGTISELISLSLELKGVSFTIDFAHLHARYNGMFKKKEDYINMFEKIEKAMGKNYIKNFHSHFTCVLYNEKGERSHLPLSAKDPDFKILAMAIKEYGIDNCTIISESPILEKDALEMKKILKEVGARV